MGILERFRLDGRKLFITGGSRGLGREMALAIAEVGADVILVGRTLETLHATADDIRKLGRNVATIQADVSIPAECEACCQQAIDQHGPIDILINNAGGRRENIPTEDMPLEKWRELMDLNLTSAFVCTKMIGGQMIARGQGGRIINIASINAFVVGGNISGRHYETAKGAMVQFTKAVAVDWAQHNITVNAICPGGFMTDANKRWEKIHPEIIDKMRSNIPAGDYGIPADLGPLAVYLASEASRYMTGATLIIDGGYTCK